MYFNKFKQDNIRYYYLIALLFKFNIIALVLTKQYYDYKKISHK